MTRRRLLIALACLPLAAYAVAAAWDRCGEWPAQPPELKALGLSQSPLRAGAGKVPLSLPFPVVVAGYAPLRPSATSAEPLFARAVVLESAGARIGVVALDVLLISPSLYSAVEGAIADLQLSSLLIVAVHSHSSVGGFDQRSVAELAGTGSYREDVHSALVKATADALRTAQKKLRPVSLEVAESSVGREVVGRSGEDADRRLLRLRFIDSEGPVAQLVTLAAHPTLVARDSTRLSADYPGHLAQLLEEQAQGTTLVLQSAGGNASVVLAQEGPSSGTQMAQSVARALDSAKTQGPQSEPALSFVRVAFSLPPPDATHVVPFGLRSLATNQLCAESPRRAELTVLQLGPVRLIAVPFEVTSAAGRALEEATGGGRVLSLANGYLGYVDSKTLVLTDDGESAHQYFDATLVDALTDAARLGASLLSASR